MNGNVITLANPDGLQTTLDVSATTTYVKNGAGASLAEVTVGSFVAASGTVASDHTTFDATAVVIGIPADGAGPGTPGDGPVGQGGPDQGRASA